MGKHYVSGTARDTVTGQIRAGSTISVYLSETTTPASIYTESTGGVAVASVLTDTNGAFGFYVDEADYAITQRFKIIASKTGYTSITYDILPFFALDCVDTDGALTANSDKKLVTQKAMKTYADTKVAHSLSTAENDFLVGAPTPFGSWIKKTLVQTKTILNILLTSTSKAIGFTISGGTISKTLTVDTDATISALALKASPAFTGTFNWAAASELTIAAGIVTVTQAIHTIDTESDDASDDLVTINGGTDGRLLAIRASHTDRTVVIKSTGNISTGSADITLDDTLKYVLFLYDNALSKWVVVGGSATTFATAAEITTGMEAAKAVPPDQLAAALFSAIGDIPYATAAGKPGRLTKGAANHKMFMNAAGTTPEWAAGIKIGTFTIDLSTTGDQAVTSVGFKPALVELWFGLDNTQCVGQSMYNGSVSYILFDLRGGTAGNYGVLSTKAAYRTDGTNTSYVVYKSLDADGFALTKSKIGSPTGIMTFFYKAWR
jgi:hypothetical protein